METANPNASEDAKKLLNWLADLPNRGSNRVVSGQMLGHGQYAYSGYTDFVEALHTATGKWVALVGADYAMWWGEVDLETCNIPFINHWDAGGLVTVSWHAENPWTGGNAWDLTDRDLVELITPGTGVNGSWMADLDRIAAGLADLRDAGVVVLWRPFHEMTYTECFWWDAGAHPGDPEPFKDMWRHMFDYFTDTKGLNNLLWVYSAADQDLWLDADYLYPGASYVDMVGIDKYKDVFEFRGEGYSRLLALGKPFALTETGPLPTRDGSWDNTNVIDQIRDNYPQTAYFQHWSSWTGNKVAIVDNQNASDLLNDSWVITRDEINWKEGGNMTIKGELEALRAELDALASADLTAMVASLDTTIASLTTLRTDLSALDAIDKSAMIAHVDNALGLLAEFEAAKEASLGIE